MDKRKSYSNIYGEKLDLRIDKVDQSINVNIFNVNSAFVNRNIIFLIILVTCNLICLLFHTSKLNISIAIFILTLICLIKLCATVTEENLVLIETLGVQIKTKFVLGSKSLFIPLESIKKIFINEVILHEKVIYLLSILTKGRSENLVLTPIFSETVPNKKALDIIYKCINLQKAQIY